MFNAVYGKWLLWAELGLCGILPAILLVVPSLRNRSSILHTAAILTCLGIVINRYVFTVQALAMPILPFDQWATYIPNWTEWATSLMVVAYGAIVVSLSYRYLPVFPRERHLNP
jgi:molybdopterin-containing oxidoreductase family membrane subunit